LRAPHGACLSSRPGARRRRSIWLRTLSAEQKLFGGPFSVTGSVSETGTGDLSKSLKASFERTW
jgi:hypothetical protein